MSARLDFSTASDIAYKAMMGLEAQINKCGIEQSLATLVRLRASQINGCAFCLDMHATEARQEGESDRRIATLFAWRETPFFTDRERAALAWTEAVTLIGQDHVPDATWRAVSPYFSEKELVELTLLIVAINGWNRFAIAFRKMPA